MPIGTEKKQRAFVEIFVSIFHLLPICCLCLLKFKIKLNTISGLIDYYLHNKSSLGFCRSGEKKVIGICII